MITITPFQAEDQEEVKTLILDGLVDHWGFLDPSKNPDLEDIARSYAPGIFLVARLDGVIVASGAYVPRSERVVEIVRMSVLKGMRRQGIGRQVLHELCRKAYESGYQIAILETTKTWGEIMAFYQRCGFRHTHDCGEDAYFALDLAAYFIGEDR